MHSQARLRHHAALLDRMSATLGIDMQQAAIDGKLRADDISDAVLRCAECPDPVHCAGWLADHASGADEPPEYCRNTDLMQRLPAKTGLTA